jgi:pimeloyl-ACP methyl ester carboxylesterase
MLYELAYPFLLVIAGGRCLMRIARRQAGGIAPGNRHGWSRSYKSRLRKLDIDLLSAIRPGAGARLALHRFERMSRPVPGKSGILPVDQLVVTTKGILAFRFAGNTQGPKVLLLHGWSADGSMMRPLATALANAGFWVVYPDLPGDGSSISAPMSFHEKGRIIAEHCAKFGPFDGVIGHSAGSLIAAIAIETGLETRKLVTICSPTSLSSLLFAYLSQTGAPQRLHQYIENIYRRLYGHAASVVGPATFARLKTNLLVAHAKRDWQVLIEEAHAILATADGATAVFLDDCNHRSILSHPELWRTVITFLDDAVERSGHAYAV